MNIDEMAKIIEAEAGVLGFQGKLGVAQCIFDNRFNASAFTKPTDHASPESKMAIELVLSQEAARIPNARLLQFRSFTKYGINGDPDFLKIYGDGKVPDNLLYLGRDSKGEYGHFYFGQYKTLKKFKLLVMAGHGRNVDGSWDPGAVGCGYQEASLTRELSRLIVERAKENNLDCDIAPDRNHYSFFKAGGKYDVTQYDYVLEVHFNASSNTDTWGDGKKKGSMTYIDQSELGHSVEDAILQKLYDIGSVQAWDGVVVTQRQETYKNGLMVQSAVRRQGVSHAVLETCFITDLDDMQWYQANKHLIATKVIEGIIEGFRLAEVDNPYGFVGKGVASAMALEDMNVRKTPCIGGTSVGVVYKNQKVEVLEYLRNGWLKIVWPGADIGYAYTSNVNNVYYKIL